MSGGSRSNWRRAEQHRQAHRSATILPAEEERPVVSPPRNVLRRPLEEPPMRRIKS